MPLIVAGSAVARRGARRAVSGSARSKRSTGIGHKDWVGGHGLRLGGDSGVIVSGRDPVRASFRRLRGSGLDGPAARCPRCGNRVLRRLRRSGRNRIECGRSDWWRREPGGRARLAPGLRSAVRSFTVHLVDVPELDRARRRRRARQRRRDRRPPDGHVELRRHRRQRGGGSWMTQWSTRRRWALARN